MQGLTLNTSLCNDGVMRCEYVVKLSSKYVLFLLKDHYELHIARGPSASRQNTRRKNVYVSCQRKLAPLFFRVFGAKTI